jgi:NhaP-type Na+/H+ or K+/H+ antiporter
MAILLLQGLSGALFGAALFYLLASLLSRCWIRVDTYRLLLFMSVAFLVAIVCEVMLGTSGRSMTAIPRH